MSDALATALQQDLLENSLYFAATALCCYDFCLTFGREVQFVWHGKQSLATALFYCFRYPALLNTIFVVLGYLPWLNWQTTQSCVIIVRFEMAGDILILTSSALFTAMRVYAISRERKWQSAVILALGLVNPAISIYTFVLSSPVLEIITPTDQACDINTRYESNSWMIAARVSSLLFEGLVMALTWHETKRIRLPDCELDTRATTKTILMRDTAIYFGFLFLVNVIGVGIGLGHLAFIEAVSTWTAILTSVLLSRLMLDLREVTSEKGTGEYGSISHSIGTLIFTDYGNSETLAESSEIEPIDDFDMIPR